MTDIQRDWYTEFKDGDGFHFNKSIPDAIDPTAEGVYVIGYYDSGERLVHTIDVGQGDIRTRLQRHVGSIHEEYPESDYTLMATCAKVDPEDYDGVEYFLALMLEPEHPNPILNRNDIEPVSINLPTRLHVPPS